MKYSPQFARMKLSICGTSFDQPAAAKLTPQALAARLAPTAPDASVARDLAGLVLQKEE